MLDDGNRLDPGEVEIINNVRKSIPVIIVITQATLGERTKTLISQIKTMFADPPDIIPIMAEPKLEESEVGTINIKAHGLIELVRKSRELLPEAIQQTFAA